MMINSLASKTRKITLLLSFFAVLIFIYGNSMLIGDKSANESIHFFKYLMEWLSFLPFFTHNFVRKLAHFIEYALLGFHLALFPYCFLRAQKREYLLCLSIGAFVALTDEGLQALVPGRNASFIDVLLDFLGVIFGFLLVFVVFWIASRRRRNH